MRRYLLLALAFITLLSGCANYKQIEIENINPVKVKMVALTKADLYLDLQVHNPTKTTFKVVDAQGKVFSDKVEFAEISLYEEFEVPPGKPSAAQAVLRVNFTDPLALLSKGLLNIENFNPDDFVVDGYVTVRGKGVTKKFDLDNIPLKEFIHMLKV